MQGLNFTCDWDSVADIEARLAQLPEDQRLESHLLQVARCMDERSNLETVSLYNRKGRKDSQLR